ncbi:MAG: FlgD immunoglobulin-like domain containing protein [Candidatus Margulisiibacteriota bacterium]
MFVLSGRYNKIEKYDPSGKKVATFNSFGGAQLRCPLGIASSPDGKYILVADTYSNRVVVYDTNGAEKYSISGNILNLYAEKQVHSEYVWGLVKTGPSIKKEEKSLAEGYLLPMGIDVAADGTTLISDGKNRLIKYQLTPNGELNYYRVDHKLTAKEVEGAVNYWKSPDWGYGFREMSKEGGLALIAGPYLAPIVASSATAAGAVALTPIGWVLLAVSALIGQEKVDGVDFYGNWFDTRSSLDGATDIAFSSPGAAYAIKMSKKMVSTMNVDAAKSSDIVDMADSLPVGVTANESGDLYVADAKNGKIYQFDQSGKELKEYQSEKGSVPIRIHYYDGNLYIADANSDRPLVWEIGGEMNDFGCSAKISPNGDGNGDSALIGYELTQQGRITFSLLNTSREEIGQLYTFTSSQPAHSLVRDSLRERGIHNELWDGLVKTASRETANISELVPDGEYFIRATVSFGDYQKSQEAKIVIDGRPPQVFISSDKGYVSPNGDGINDSAILKMTVTDYSLTVDAYLLAYRNGRLIDSPWKEQGLLTGMEREYVWNGKVDGLVYDGNYSFALRATDDCGNMGTGSCEVVVDSQPPLIDDFQIDNPAFSPNGDDRKDLLTANFKLRDYGSGINTVEVEVVDGNGLSIPLTAYSLPLNAFSLTWSGKNSASQPVPDGKYWLKVTAVDKAGNRATISNSIEVDTVFPVISAATAEPNPFTPNGDGVKDTTTFKSHFSESVESNIMVYNEEGKLFRELRPLSMGSYLSLPWNGQGEHGEVIGGNYSYTILAEDRAGNLVTSEAGLIVVDREPSLVKYGYGENDPFSPAIEPGRIKYALSRDNLKVSVVVIGREKQIVKTLIDGVLKNKGEYSVDWDGGYSDSYVGPHSSRDDKKVPDGAYQVKIMAYDDYNLASGESSFNLAVDATPPFITLQPVKIDYAAKSASLKYYLPEKSMVTVKVFSKDGELLSVATLAKEAGAQEYIAVTSGECYFEVIAEDSAGNRDDKKSETFLTEPTALRIAEDGVSPATFTPNGDGHTDLTQVSYALSGGVPPYTVTVNILSPLGTINQCLVDNEPQWPGKWAFAWMPYSALRPLPADGYYQYEIKVLDSVGTAIDKRGSVLVVSTWPTVSLSLGTPVFSPNDDGTLDTLDFQYVFNYSTYYQPEPGQVKLQVLSTNGEILWEKGITQSAGNYVYPYDGVDNYGRKLDPGSYYARISATDSLDSPAVYQTLPFSVDYTNPEPTAFSVSPSYAKIGSEVLINLQFAEELAEAPIVQVILSDGTVKLTTLKTTSGANYQYQYNVIGDDKEGPAVVSIQAIDEAGNRIAKSLSFIVDKTNPSVSEINISPDPVSLTSIGGPLSVKFRVSEPLQTTKVYVSQPGGPILLAITGGDWTAAGGLCEAKYDPYAGADGTAAISIEVTDLAGNQAIFNRNVVIDTTKPIFSQINSVVSGGKYAKAGTTVAITFDSSEQLPFNPMVRVNDNDCAYYSGQAVSAGYEYEYRYNVGSDIEGPAVITISGQDYARNECFVQTSSTTEGFIIDLTNPTVGIALPGGGDIIASPSPFYTNADPLDTGGRPNYTTLRYSISEDGYVTLKVHRVPNDQTIYAASDFREDNRAATIVDDVLQYQGTHNVQWRGESTTIDSNSDGFADPGKYAFIVEVRDLAGNLTQRKWGGTVWVQNNVLNLIQPETIGINPDPLYFSPAGNSSLNSTKIWFTIDLSITPEEAAAPERIEAMGLEPSKRVGTYTVKVFDNGNNLVRTIVKDISAYSASPEAVVWDGRVGTGVEKLAAGDPTADGAYKITVEVKDFAGNPAGGSPFSKWVTVDSTPPIITDNQLGNDTWTNSSGTLYDVDFADNGSKLLNVVYQVRRPDSSYSAWLPLTAVATGAAGYTDNWPVDWSNCAEGVNYISVKAADRAGNETTLTDVFYLKKDTVLPVTCTPPNPPRTPYNQLRPLWSWTPVSDATSGVKGYYIKIGTSAGGDNVVSSTYVGDVTSWTTNRDLWNGATFYASLQSVDNAGNLGVWSNPGLVTIDTQPPVISGISDDGPFSPGVSVGSDDSITFNYSVSENCYVYLFVDGTIRDYWEGSGAHSFTWSPDGSTINELDPHSYYIYAIDLADNTATSANYPFVVDKTAPVIISLTFQHRAIIPDGTLTSMMIFPSVSGATLVNASIKAGATMINSFSNVGSGFSWNARNSGGALVSPGNYTVEINAYDNAGNSSTLTRSPLRVKSRDEIVFVDDNSGAVDDIRTVKFNSSCSSYTQSFFTTSRDWISHPALTDFGGRHLLAVHQLDGTDKIVIYDPQSTDPNGLSGNIPLTPDNDNYSLAAGNFDGNKEGNDQIAVANPSSLMLNIYRNNGTPGGAFSVCGGRIAAGDVDGDGYDEIVAINGVNIYIHHPHSSTPATAFSFAAPNSLWNVACGDYDGNGIDDIFVTAIQNYGGPIKTNYTYVYNSSGTLLNQKAFVDASPFPFISAGDYNGDGMSEVAVVTDSGGDTWMKVFNPRTGQMLCDGAVANRCWYMSSEDVDCAYGAGVSAIGKSIVIMATTLESPSLIAPAKDRQDVQNIRPAFEWQHHKADTTEYRVEVAKNDSFTIDHQTFSKAAGTGTQDKSDSNLYAFNYAIHEFDPGLERNTDYFWKVTALSPTNSATSETWSFRIQPELTLVGVTNYPNPFNPNREQTKIRYRLSADADEVRIRIYDITGSLVTELDGTTNGEGMSVWQKYNDVSWDGRNGRGDLVVNGIYPFEITARIGDRSISGRGKAAVLK